MHLNTDCKTLGVLAAMEDQSYVEEGYEDYVEDQQYEDYSNMGDGTEISKGEFRSSKDIRADDKQVNWCLLQ